MPVKDSDLVARAIEARELAYAPYSKFLVGTALETDSGSIYTGCNIENVSYGATCCAERTAIYKAVSEGHQKIRKMAVVCGGETFCLPCGICRQVILEFASEDFLLLAANLQGQYRQYRMDELLPNAFKDFER